MLQKMVICSFIFVLIVSGCKGKIEPGTADRKKSAVVKADILGAQIVNQPLLYETSGTVHAKTESTLSSKLMAAVKKINVKEGDLITKGEVLVILDNSQVNAQLQQAEQAREEAIKAHAAALSGADSSKAAAKLAADTYKRYLNLFNDRTISRQEFENIETKNSQAKAALSQAEAMVEAANHRVKQAEAAVSSARSFDRDSAIYAPYNGIVTAKMMEEGDLASPGTPIIGVEETESYHVEFVVPETGIKNTKIGTKINIIIPASNDLSLEGTVYTITPAADYKTRSFMIKASFPSNKMVRSGMYARVLIPSGEAGILLIPSSALVYQGQLTEIYVLDHKNIARFRVIRTGRFFGKSVEVLSGLKPGERYVSKPQPNITDGVTVEASL